MTEGAPCRPNPQGEWGVRPWIFVGPLHRCYRIAVGAPPCPGPHPSFAGLVLSPPPGGGLAGHRVPSWSCVTGVGGPPHRSNQLRR